MPPRCMLTIWVRLGALTIGTIACGADDEQSDSTIGATSAPTTGSPATTAGSAASGGSGGAIDLGPCGPLADCVEGSDQPITPFLAAYGPEGTCWEMFSQEQCWQDCHAQYQALVGQCGANAACCECETIEDCSYSDDFDLCAGNACVGAGAYCGYFDDLCGGSVPPTVSDYQGYCAGGSCPAELVALGQCYETEFPADACTELNTFLYDCLVNDSITACSMTPCGDQFTTLNTCLAGG